MTRMNDLDERRIHARFRVQEGAFAAPRSDARKLWQIIDISRGGLAFRYVDHGDAFDKSSELEIITRDTLFSVENIPFRSISDSEIADETLLSYTIRRHGVEFGTLGFNQESQLEHFIENHTEGEI